MRSIHSASSSDAAVGSFAARSSRTACFASVQSSRAIDAGATDAPALRAKIDVFEVAGQPDGRKGQTDSDDPGATQPEPRRP